MTGTELATRTVQIVKTPEAETTTSAAELPWMARIEEHPSWDELSHLRVRMRVGVALDRFRVRDLLTLEKGQVFQSRSASADDVPLMIGHIQLGWSEFEVQDQRMALRLTRLS